MTKKGLITLSFVLLLITGNAYATGVFYEDWDGNGSGIGDHPDVNWTLSGDVLEAGSWGLFPNEGGATPNLTAGSGQYAGVIRNSFEFIDTWAWLTSPVIDIAAFDHLVLSADIYYRTTAAFPGEDIVPVRILAPGTLPTTLETIGSDLFALSDPIAGRLSWDLLGVTSDTIQIAFGWYSSWDAPDYRNIQIDNVLLEGRIKPVPEPGTMLLLGIGLLGLGVYHKKHALRFRQRLTD